MSAQDQRPRFYEGQYLAADDVASIVEYGHVQSARHELGAHTWGTLIGLTLVERSTPGPPSQKLVYLTPGVAEDGFGRKLLSLSYTRLSESLFSNIVYDGTVDDPAQNNGVPPGRFVKVWITYDEKAGQAAAPGFANCDAGDTYARVQETYRFVIGDPPSLTARRSSITVGGRVLDAAQALQSFDGNAPVLSDASVPQQQFPETTQGVIWLVPVGVVRWVVGASGGGYFVDRDIDTSQPGTDLIRRQMRVYAGAIAETVGASDGALVLRNRGDDPRKPGRFQERLQSAEPLANIFNDLVWVEGNLRVVGDERLAGGALRFVDVSGHDGNTPLSLERWGDQSATPGARSLYALIGPASQADNRFAVATATPNSDPTKPPTLSEKLTCLSGGNVGVSKSTPQYRLHVAGDRIRLESTDGSKTLDMRTDDTDVTLESTTNNLYVRATGGTPAHNLLLNAADADGNVGIGNSSPAYKLDVKAKTGIKLGLEGNGGGQLILSNLSPGDNTVHLEGLDQAGTGTSPEVSLSGRAGANLPELTLNADNVHVLGGSILLENLTHTKRLELFNTGSEVDLLTDTNSLSLRSTNNHHCLINWLSGDGNVGIGLGAPTQKLHVSGPFMQVDGAGNEQAYLGGDGAANDVQIGSMNNSVTAVSCWNAGTNSAMSIGASAFNHISDAQLKQDVRPLGYALDTVRRLRGVRFKWRSTGAASRSDELGVIAQEVAQVVPEAVSRVRGHNAIALNAMVPLLIEALKELSTSHDDLKNEVAELKNELAELKRAPASPRDENSRKPEHSPGHEGSPKSAREPAPDRSSKPRGKPPTR